jgi:hypothetical protein
MDVFLVYLYHIAATVLTYFFLTQYNTVMLFTCLSLVLLVKFNTFAHILMHSYIL